MKATELTHDNIGEWFRFSHDGFERFGRLKRIEFTKRAFDQEGSVITIAWDTADKLTGVAYDLKADTELTPVDAPETDAS